MRRTSLTARVPLNTRQKDASAGWTTDSHKVRTWTMSNNRVSSRKLQRVEEGRREYCCSIKESRKRQRLETKAVVVEASFLREDLPYFTELLAEVISLTKYTSE